MSSMSSMSSMNRIDNSISLVFINGCFSEKLSNMNLLPPEVICTYSDGLFLQIPPYCTVSQVIHLIFINSDLKNDIKNNIRVGENSRIILIEEYLSQQSDSYSISTHVTTEMDTGQNAEINYYKIQNEHVTATHKASIIIQQKKDSRVNTFFADYGGHLAHENVTVHLNEPGASCQMNGIYYLHQDEQAINNTIRMNHTAAFCSSSMLYKGVLDKKSQAVFNGKIHVPQESQKTIAYQANHNLLLSANSEIKTKPELEIYADDVKCTHGATVGQLNEAALFYLQTRGIEKAEALKLLTQAFVSDVIEKITDISVKEYMQQRVSQYETL